MIGKILKALRDGTFFAKVMNRLRYVTLIFITSYLVRAEVWIKRLLGMKNARGVKTDPHKILFATFSKHYNDNPREIAEEIIRRKLPVKMVWIVPNQGYYDKNEYPEVISQTVIGTREMFLEQMEAKIWIDNSLTMVQYNIPKKKDQVYINTWHGSMGIKILTGTRQYESLAARGNRLMDYLLINSTFEEGVFRNSWFPDPELLRYGHPRNDIVFRRESHEAIRKKVLDHYGLQDDVHLCLYAPTFRDDGNDRWNNIDFRLFRLALQQRFGGEWAFLMRYHFRTHNTNTLDEPWVINATDYPEIYDLMIASDFGCTDYSSWAYDYVLLEKPLLIYAPDIDAYNNTRGFYYKLEETPFPIATDNSELEERIMSFDSDEYKKKIAQFLEDRGCYEDGKAASRTVDLIERIISENDREDE